MRVITRQIIYIGMIAVLISLGTTLQAQTVAYRVSDRQVETLLTRIENRTDTFKNQVDRSLDNSNIDGTRQEDSINSLVGNFENATNRLKDNFSSRRSSGTDVEEVLRRAAFINSFMRNNRMSSASQSTWTQIRTDLNTLAGYYRVSANWTIVTPSVTNVYIGSDTQVRNLLNSVESRTNTFKRQIGNNLNNSNLDGTNREDSINTMVANFEIATNRLKNNFSSRRSTAADVQEVLNRAVGVNSFVVNNTLSSAAETSWTRIRNDLNTLAGYYRVAANWTVVTPSVQNVYYGSDTQVRSLLNSVESRTNAFKRQIANNLNSSNIDGTNREDSINAIVANFETATNRLKNNFSSRRSTTADVQEVLNRAVPVNRFVLNNRLSSAAENSWTQIRNDLNTLAGYYRVSSNWNNTTGFPGGQYGDFDSRLTGTYRLNTSQSDNISTIVDRAMTSANYSSNQRDRMRQSLERRLGSPETLTYEKRGQQVTMGSSIAAPVTLTADGVKQTETSSNGRTVTTSVTATNRDLTINYEGDRINDYYVSFMPMNNGQLKVTRRIYLENQNTTVTASSVYDKTSQTPQWATAGYSTYPGNTSNNGFMVPNNTSMIATLDSPLSTRTAQDGDRFSMTVTSPSQYDGAVIEGTVNGEKSGVVSGRANMALTFNTIRMRNGQVYSFAGIVDQVRNANGDTINVNNEGQIRDGSQTTKTVTRAGIGAVLGAIIGAIAGGGSGAAIGAGVGAGAGAGTVILQGRDNLELANGSQFNITATAPSNVGAR